MLYQCQSIKELPGWPEPTRLMAEWIFGIPQGTRLAKVQGLITTPDFPLTREQIEAMESLVVVSAYGTGYDYIDVAGASDLGILVTHTPTAVVEATAELGLTLIMALMRHILPHDHAIRRGRPEDRINPGFTGQELTHNAKSQVVGLVGYGRVARRLAEMLHAIGFHVIYTRQHGPLEGHAGYHDLPDLLSHADFVVILTPLTRDTFHLIGETELNHMKPTACLVNISRGPCVDEQALIRFLSAGRIAGAALDVFEDEPHVPMELTQLPMVVLSPHVGTQTWETRAQMTHDALANIEKGLGGVAQNAVNAEYWTRRPHSE